jgi:hypothetical protein
VAVLTPACSAMSMIRGLLVVSDAIGQSNTDASKLKISDFDVKMFC